MDKAQKEFALHCLNVIGYFDGAPLPDNMRITGIGGGELSGNARYFTAVKGDDLYICVRGATEPGDFEMVLDFESRPFLDGYVHGGIEKASRWVLSQLQDQLNGFNGRVICTGHSLGAVTTSLIAMILKYEMGKSNIIALNFAPFPIFSKSIAERTKSFITTVIFNNDIVPRINGANISKLLSLLVPPEGPQREMGKNRAKTMVLSMMQNVMKSQGVTDQKIVASVYEKVGNRVIEMIDKIDVIRGYQYFLGGILFHVIEKMDAQTAKKNYRIESYNENLGLDLFGMMMGVSEHFYSHYKQVIPNAFITSVPLMTVPDLD